jgi:hypothetical protein
MWVFYKNLFPTCDRNAIDYAYIFVEHDGDYARLAHPIFEKKFGFDPAETCESCEEDHFSWSICKSMIADTAEARGCKWSGSEWLEEPKDEEDPDSYISFDKFMKLSDVIKIPLVKTYDGQFCVRCGNFYPMAEPNDGNKFRCFMCRRDPWR